jgi:colanic acid biosynthesis glycosyl transferase WcaI
LEDKFVVMYSGNHSPCHPLDTLLEAARRLVPDPRIVFCFVGGGSEFRKIQQRQELTASRTSPDRIPVNANDESGRLPNVICLPYQPLEQLAGSLSAADLHVVVMGDPFVGIIHPCKIYNILGVGAPILYVGPKPSHISDIFAELEGRPWTGTARHGDADEVVRLICSVAAAEAKSPPRQPSLAASRFSKAVLLGRLVSELESSASRRVQDR